MKQFQCSGQKPEKPNPYSMGKKVVNSVPSSLQSRYERLKKKEPMSLAYVQTLAPEEFKRKYSYPCLDKFHFESTYGPKRSNQFCGYLYKKLLNEYSLIDHVKVPRGLRGKGFGSLYTFILKDYMDSSARLVTIGNGVKYLNFLTGDKGAVSLQGSDNAHRDLSLYLNHKLIKGEIRKLMSFEEKRAKSFFKSFFEFRVKAFKKTFKNYHRFRVLERFWVFHTNDAQEDYKILCEIINDLYGRVLVEVNKTGEIGDSIKYRFKDDERNGLEIKIYRHQANLIKIEIRGNEDFFGAKSNNYKYKGLTLNEAYESFESLSWETIKPVLFSDLRDFSTRLPKSEAIDLIRNTCPKYGPEIIDRFRAGNGFCVVKSTFHFYRSVKKLRELGLVIKQRRSSYLLSDEMMNLIQ